MVVKQNAYTKMQQEFYDSTADIMAIENHRGHDSNPDYYGILLSDVVNDPQKWTGKTALDFGCGIGRNVDNMLKLANWSSVEGCDISSENIVRADDFLSNVHPRDNYKLYTTTGVDLQPIESDRYDFVMSTIVLQHIAVYDIRNQILNDIYRVMKDGGLFSFQMAMYNRDHIGCAGYFDNTWDAPGTNGRFDVSVDPAALVKDLEGMGFRDINYVVTPEWDANYRTPVASPHSRWVWVKAWK